MCTVSAYIKPSGTIKLVFFQNRDKPVEGFEGHELRVLEDHIVGVFDYRSQGLACGFSPKTGLYMGVANIKGPRRRKSRGILILETLRSINNIFEAKSFVMKELLRGTYSPAVFIIADRNTIVRIEGYGEAVATKQGQKLEVATNTLRLLPFEATSKNSKEREKLVYESIKKHGFSEKGITHLLTSHAPVPVCRHGLTLSSMIVIDRGERQEVLFADGEPCKGYQAFNVREKDGRWVLRAKENK